jgi:hypothetical protein
MRALLILLLCASGSTALAQAGADPRDVMVARQEFRAGIAAARDGRWAEARDRFARSYELNPRRSALFNLAGAQARTGELVAAAESYRRYLELRDEERAAEAEARLDELTARIPLVTVRASLAEGDALTLDGAPLRRVLLTSPIPVDPGAHRLAVRRDEAEVAAEDFEAPEGARVEVVLDVPRPPVALAAVPDPADPALLSDTPSEPDDGGTNVLTEWWFWTIAGVVVVGAVGTGLAIGLTPGQPPSSNGFDVDLVRVP